MMHTRPGVLVAALNTSFRGAPARRIPGTRDRRGHGLRFAGSLPARELVGLAFDISGRVPGLDPEEFRRAVEAASAKSLAVARARERLPVELACTLGAYTDR